MASPTVPVASGSKSSAPPTLLRSKGEARLPKTKTPATEATCQPLSCRVFWIALASSPKSSVNFCMSDSTVDLGWSRACEGGFVTTTFLAFLPAEPAEVKDCESMPSSPASRWTLRRWSLDNPRNSRLSPRSKAFNWLRISSVTSSCVKSRWRSLNSLTAASIVSTFASTPAMARLAASRSRYAASASEREVTALTVDQKVLATCVSIRSISGQCHVNCINSWQKRAKMHGPSHK